MPHPSRPLPPPRLALALVTLLAAAGSATLRVSPAGARPEAAACDAILGAPDVAQACGGSAGVSVSVSGEARSPGDERAFFRRAEQTPEGRYDVTRCARRFDAAGRHLFVTVAKVGSSSDNRDMFASIEPTLAQSPGYREVPGIGDGARRFDQSSDGMRIHALEFIDGRWSVSLRTALGAFEGERYEPLCTHEQLEELARQLATRLED